MSSELVIMNNNSSSTNYCTGSNGGRLRSRTFSYRPSPMIITSNTNNTTSFPKTESNISNITSSSINRRRSKSTIGSSPDLEYKKTELTLSSQLLLDKYEEDLSEKLNKIESSNLSIKNLFNHKRRLSAGSNQQPSINY